MPFIAFIVTTAFVFANLIIAVVCDAVHVLGDDDVANIIGFENNEGKLETKDKAMYGNRSVDHLFRLNSSNALLVTKSKVSTSQKLHDLDSQLNHLVRTTNHLMFVIDSLAGVPDNRIFRERTFILGEETVITDQKSCDTSDLISNNVNAQLDMYDKDIEQSIIDSANGIKKSGLKTPQQNRNGTEEIITIISALPQDKHQTNPKIGEQSPGRNLHSDQSMIISRNESYRTDNKELASALAIRNYKKESSRTISEISEQFIENVQHVAGHVVANPPMRELNAARKMAGTVINNDRVQYFILALIVINAIMMGVATFPAVKDNPDVSSIFELTDQIFLWIFTFESGFQLIFHGWRLFKDGFLVFDMLIVILSWAMEGTQVIRAFRIFRALRIVNRVKVMKNLILAVFNVLPNLTSILMLLFLVFYIFAVMFTELYKDTSKQYPPTKQYFVGLPETFFTLFQMMTLASSSWLLFYLQ